MTVEDPVLGRYRGRTVVCAASGPSLVASDLELVRESGLPLLVCNDTWRLAPWADCLVAMDAAWWRQNGTEAAAFPGLRVGFTVHCLKWGATYSTVTPMIHSFGNSGAAAISVAVRGKAARILLLGYDAAAGAQGQLHWHPDHAAPLKNPQASLHRWPAQFEKVADHAAKAGTSVVNCSRRTVLACFTKQPLEEALRNSPFSGSSMSAASGGRPPASPRRSTATAPSP